VIRRDFRDVPVFGVPVFGVPFFGVQRLFGAGASDGNESPLVCLDNEGQFRLCLGKNFAEALLEQTYSEDAFDELRQWLGSIGISIAAEATSDLAEPAVDSTPKQLHETLYRKYLGR
jgi:hypothetical protein